MVTAARPLCMRQTIARKPDPDPEAPAALAEHLRSSIGKLNRRLREAGNLGNFGDFTLSQSKVMLALERTGHSKRQGVAVERFTCQGFRQRHHREFVVRPVGCSLLDAP